MILIIDSNIVFAALLRDGLTRGLLIDSPFTLYAPETMLKEINKYKEEICKRTGLDAPEFEVLFCLITESIEIVSEETYRQKMDEATQLMGHIDKGDVPFLALALGIPNHGIWTENLRHFEKQTKV